MSRTFELEPVSSWDVDNDIVCAACDELFKAGEACVTRAVDDWQDYRTVPVHEQVCLACAFTGRTDDDPNRTPV